MSPYLVLRRQRKGRCSTSTFTSACGSFPAAAAASSADRKQLSAVTNMLPAAPLPAVVGEAPAGTDGASAGQQQLSAAASSTWQLSSPSQKPLRLAAFLLTSPAHRWSPPLLRVQSPNFSFLIFFYCLSGTCYIHARGVCGSELHASHRDRKLVTKSLPVGGGALTWQTATQVHMQHLNFINTVNVCCFFLFFCKRD